MNFGFYFIFVLFVLFLSLKLYSETNLLSTSLIVFGLPVSVNVLLWFYGIVFGSALKYLCKNVQIVMSAILSSFVFMDNGVMLYSLYDDGVDECLYGSQKWPLKYYHSSKLNTQIMNRKHFFHWLINIQSIWSILTILIILI